ncbi:MAG TPA: PAS domain-containing protein [Desulfobacteraceae bacterium]|nr:PAS domain-containing protein [Desulfobacteraceae bacterium]
MERIISNKKNLELILNNLEEGIIAHDLNRRIFFFNDVAERITGYSKEEVIGKDCHDAFGGPLCGEHCAFKDDDTISAGKDRYIKDKYILNILSKNGDPRRIEMSVISIKDENDDFFGVLSSFTDQTDLFNLQLRADMLTSFANIIGNDGKMLQIFQQIRDVSGYDYPINISGETGTGKELVAVAIHNESRRGGGMFVPINCGALPEGLIESELFGHVKGAFSGAIRDKKGRFELGDKGTVFLDEVAELTKFMQIKLLRFLQEGRFEKVGGEKTISVDVRIISATNKDLKKEVMQGSFREDLYYRLNVIPIYIPPLRERKSDIPLLVDHFLKDFKKTDDRKLPRISKQAMSLLMGYKWPGNVRELQNAIRFSIVKCSDRIILPNDLPLEIKGLKNIENRRGPVKKLNAASVKSALKKTGGNKAKAAKLLGVGRATLYRFLDEYPEVLREVIM